MMEEEIQNPTMKDLAILASQTYSTADPKYEQLGYTKVNDLSTKDIHTYHHEPKKHYVIAHRGTDLNSENDKISQMSADFKILQGNQKADKLHRDRAKDTERIVKHIREKDDHDIYLTGHSLAASTIQNTLIKKPYVLDNVKSVHTFNAGTSPIFKVDLDKKSKKYKQIAEKSTHHIIKGDAISENANNSMIGKIKRYTSKLKPTFKQRFMNGLGKLSFISPLAGLAHWAGTKIVNTARYHSIDNFLL